MKKALLYLIALMVYSAANATNYYISSSSGNDKNNGNSANSAWKTIAKLNSARWNLQPGDSVLFKCNDTLAGQLVPSRSGTAGKYIYYGSYGSGNKPILSGTTKVSSWTETSTNIWEATCPDCGNTVTNFFINGIAQQIGRWPNVTDPNKGYRTYESHSGSNQITDNELTDAINWTGAEAVVRTNRWVLDHLTIKSHVGNTLQFTSPASYEFLNGFGYFIQNDPRTLDQQGEWYYNPKYKKFSLYSNIDPNTLSTYATKFDTLLNTGFKIRNLNYITIENLHFDGSCTATMVIPMSSHINIRNNEITNSGENAVLMDYSDSVIFENNLVNHTNNKVIRQYICNNFIMRNNIIKNTALVTGMGSNGSSQYLAVNQQGNNALIENNTIDSTGYIGIFFEGDTLLIRNNVISNYAMTVDDCGGLYTWGGDGTTINHSRKLIGNIIYNAIGAPDGTDRGYLAASGICLDDRTNNVDIIDNTIFNCTDNGIAIHNSNHINVKRNNVYDNGTQLCLAHDSVSAKFPITNCTIDSNIFVSKKASQLIGYFTTIDNGISDFGNFDYNYYCRPLDDNSVINLDYINGIKFDESHTLSSWSSKYNKDQHSGKSPIAVKEYTITNTVPPNLITNEAFDNVIYPWYCWSPYSNCQCSDAFGEGLWGGNALKASFTPSGKTDGNMFVISNNFSLTKDKIYRVKFAARSSQANSAIMVTPRQNEFNYKPVADVRVFGLDINYKKFEYIFTQDSNVTNARVDFQFSEGQGTVWLDSIEVNEVNALMTNPDDYIRFEYNATKNDKSISLTCAYVDVNGMPVSGNITLKPFTSVILFKKICRSLTPIQPGAISGNANICPGTSNTYSIAAVSGATYYTWKLPNAWTGASTTNSITAKAGTTGGNITVTANNECCSSAPQTLIVRINIIPATPKITLNKLKNKYFLKNKYILKSNETNGNQWYLNKKIIKNATNDTYITSLIGNYFVIVTLKNGCPSKPSNTITIKY